MHFQKFCEVLISVKLCRLQSFTKAQPSRKWRNNSSVTGFPQALEIMQKLENQEKKFHAWINHGI